VSTFDEASLAAEAARCLQVLGQPAAARRQAELVVQIRPPYRIRSRALAQITMASALIFQGHTDEACTVSRELLRSTRELGSYLVLRQLDRLQQALMPYRNRPHVVAYLDESAGELQRRQWLAHWMPAGAVRTT
jgi:hypothetical protein